MNHLKQTLNTTKQQARVTWSELLEGSQGSVNKDTNRLSSRRECQLSDVTELFTNNVAELIDNTRPHTS
jgi:hypothetical protein